MPEQAEPRTENIIPISAEAAKGLTPERVKGPLYPEPSPPPKPWVYPAKTPIYDEAEFRFDCTADFIPRAGFLRDFCEARAGYETSPLFLLWGGLLTLAAATRRRVGLRWGSGMLYPNLYVFLCAPPGSVKKSIAIDLAAELLSEFAAYCKVVKLDGVEAYNQSPNILSGKGTPESLTKFLAPRENVFAGVSEDGKNRPLKVELGSQGDIIVSELTTFLNTSSYNEVLVDRLTDFWDCRAPETTEITVGRGKEVTKEVFVNMFAGTTPQALRDSLPEKAWGGGFVSRLCLVFVPTPTRCVPTPYVPDGYPVASDLKERLYWCVKNAKDWGPESEFTLAPDARAAYIRFYKLMHDSIVENQELNHHSQNRLTQLVLKVAMLVRMSRYDAGREISLEDFELAKRIMLYTQGNSKYATDSGGDSQFLELLDTITLYLHKEVAKNMAKGMTAEEALATGITRKAMVRKMSGRGFRTGDFDAAITQLTFSGLTKIDGSFENQVRINQNQVYSLAELTKAAVEEAENESGRTSRGLLPMLGETRRSEDPE